ncbi:hypothetical protein SAMN05444392_11024 [Seinonella peptonophila]|uniref:Uncharacterized protein n=1 Tax=Seinonella peptonophila TaxID=112248 RepID=A0A1M4ZNN3_9BACL|nr:hypothetical protein [Seinonella peptonophila]SHF19608.1 hypothetical protein SAMN05444392_11024 [Seinonella peptonophila]
MEEKKYDNKNVFHFAKENKGIISIGQDESVHFITMNKMSNTENELLLEKISELIQWAQQTNELSEEQKEDIIDLGETVSDQIEAGKPKSGVIKQLNARLGDVRHLLAGGQLGAGLVSMVMDLLQSFLKG